MIIKNRLLLMLVILATVATDCNAKKQVKRNVNNKIIKKGSTSVPIIKGSVSQVKKGTSSSSDRSSLGIKANNMWNFIIANDCTSVVQGGIKKYTINLPDADDKYPQLKPTYCTNQTQAGLIQLIINNNPEIFLYKWKNLSPNDRKTIVSLKATAGPNATPMVLADFVSLFPQRSASNNITQALKNP